LHATG
jgi:hypothetical protein